MLRNLAKIQKGFGNLYREMQLLVMRHGEAEVESKTGDSERHLTRRGLIQVKNVLIMAKTLGSRVDSITSSPLTRAKETANIASMIFGHDFTVSDSLEPEASPERVYEFLSKYDPSSSALLITHQPLVSRLVADLLGTQVSIHHPTGSLAIVNVSGHPCTASGTLALMIPPSVRNS